MNIFIYAYPYNENVGGIIALHRLCHVINSVTQHKAYLVPHTWSHSFFKQIHDKIKRRHVFKLKDGWKTPIWKKKSFPLNAVAIYPEVVEGNPFGITNVVRWLLHQPGFHTGKVEYGNNELYFKFNSAINDFKRDTCKLAKHELKVIYYPIDIYRNQGLVRDIDCCYIVRKGQDKPHMHPQSALCLDGKSHTEVANIFNRSKQFISYDDYTAYSLFAVLSGCESIVVPTENVPLDEWYPNISDRYGIAYGFSDEQREWAEQTKAEVLQHIVTEHKKVEKSVVECLDEVKDFFRINELD